MVRVFILKTDITELDVDAIVNSANSSLLAGSGLCGLIHRKAGNELENECKGVGGCPKGNAVITDGYNLKAGKIIHAAGPHYYFDSVNAPELLKNCYLSIFRLADKHELKSIAIPAISTGVYRYPLRDATDIALAALSQFLEHENNSLSDIVFAVSSDEHVNIYREFHRLHFSTEVINK